MKWLQIQQSFCHRKNIGYICIAPSEPAALLMSNSDNLRAWLINVTNDANKKLWQLLANCTHIFACRSVTLGRTGIVRCAIDTDEARPICQPLRHIPAPLPEVGRFFEEAVRNEVMEPLKLPWVALIALAETDGNCRLCRIKKAELTSKEECLPITLHQWFVKRFTRVDKGRQPPYYHTGLMISRQCLLGSVTRRLFKALCKSL